MFFLKYLPTQSLILNYQEHFPDGAEPKIASRLEMLREASLLLRDLEDFFRAHDFSLTRFLICVILDRADEQGGLQHSEIVERIDVSSPVISRSLKSLIDEGFVSVESETEGRRTKRNRLTDAGKARLQSLMPGYYEILLK
mgnify:CR=1 FL=1